jgi:hypothetical protein
VALASVLLAQFGVSFDPFGGAKSRVTVSAFPRRVSPRPARAALGARCHRCVGGAHVLDDRFGRRRLGRAVARRSAPDARAGVARQHVALQRRAQARASDSAGRRRRALDARTLVDPMLLCSPRTAAP